MLAIEAATLASPLAMETICTGENFLTILGASQRRLSDNIAHAANAAGLVVRVVGAMRHCSGAREYGPSDRSLLNHFYAIPVGTLLPLFHSDPTWGDSLFERLTMENVTPATQMYVLADKLLGPQPQVVPQPLSTPPSTFDSKVWASMSSETIWWSSKISSPNLEFFP